MTHDSILTSLVDCLHTCTAPDHLEDLPFYEAIYPWVITASQQLQSQLKREEQGALFALLSAEGLRDLELSLAKRLSGLCTPCMHTKLAIAQVEFSLQGSSPRERYLDHIRKNYLSEAGLRAFLEEYHELGRQVSIILSLWIATTVELLERVKEDLSVLETTFNEGLPLGTLSSVTTNLGDFHNGGHSVSILGFSCGTSIIYKPKNIQISEIFYDFIQTLNTEGLSPPLKGYRLLARGEYGWEEKVEHLPCQTSAEVERYYERAGMYLCLFYLMNGSDMHYENVIASGEHPMLIDLETLFHGVLRFNQKEEAVDRVQHSVLSTGFLPFFFFNQKKQKNVDISSLGSDGTGFTLVTWTHLHTDEITKSEEANGKRALHTVRYDGKTIAAKNHLSSLLSGFHRMYTFLEGKKDLFEKEGWWNSPIRIVLRGTRFYGYILQRLHSSECILNRESCERELSLLERFTDPRQQFPKHILEAEKKAVLQGDIPYFYSFPKSTHLFFQGKVVESGCLEPLHLPLYQMQKDDRKIQEIYIRQSFFIKDAPLHETQTQATSVQEMEKLPTAAEILSQVQTIASNLKNRAFMSKDGSLGWIHLEPNNHGVDQLSLQPLSDTLYSGRAGIALFFAALARITRNPEWKEAALSSLIPLCRTIHQGQRRRLINLVGIGGMTGIGGVIYGLLHTGKLLDLPELTHDAQTLIQSIEPKHIQEDLHYDLIFGSAGFILSLLNYHTHTKDPKVLSLATLAGEHLCRKASSVGKGALAWPGVEKLHLLGMSHGTAGIALALIKLARATGNTQFESVASSAISWERFRFNAEKKNWPRLSSGPETYMSAWCHGATGIGFARLAGLDGEGDPQTLNEIEAAIEVTLAHFNTSKLTLCCGDPGRLEFLRSVREQLGRQDLDSSIARCLSSVFARMQKTQESGEFPSPGFMQGSAGQGFFLLRQIDKEGCLPQPLLLQ